MRKKAERRITLTTRFCGRIPLCPAVDGKMICAADLSTYLEQSGVTHHFVSKTLRQGRKRCPRCKRMIDMVYAPGAIHPWQLSVTVSFDSEDFNGQKIGFSWKCCHCGKYTNSKQVSKAAYPKGVVKQCDHCDQPHFLKKGVNPELLPNDFKPLCAKIPF
ncbi:MAG: hypothetical protein CEN89_92 [Candidatus Berkelbacteria bacterium Licking1014_7]|uniref:Uncharacterized protein n=1 Tax=Candidatus Berkelbacteria bacterium Licking1014_7 TaxID=2017147 RepID=A0A554LKP7_9BACT|nr:MAG: hypothetical protein CEN89_92 [Candidatus Berkelbacteria bacterium Licking1014_7]